MPFDCEGACLLHSECSALYAYNITVYCLNKIVGFLASPIGGAIAGGVVAVVCARFGRKRLAKWLGGLTVTWLWLWMTPVMTWVVGVPLEREFLVGGRVPAVEIFPEADAIVVLGGGMGIETNLNHYAEMWASADRVWQAARLWKAEKAPKVIATSGRVEETTFPLLREFGVPDSALVKVDDARNTEEEARSVCKMGVKRILLVTSAWHMKRARMMFEKYAQSVEVICAPADFENMMMATRGFSLVPDFNAFAINSVAFHEWVGIIGYTLFR